MVTTIFNYPDDDGDINSGKKEAKKQTVRVNEKALCRAFINQFHTMGILTSAETGLIINRIDGNQRPTL